MMYAEVSVNSPLAQRKAFSYAIPPHLSINVGDAVWVPFGDRLLQGVVLKLSPYPAVEETREIDSIIEPQPLLSQHHVSLSCWLSDYYLSPLFDAVSLMLPPGFERNAVRLRYVRDENVIAVIPAVAVDDRLTARKEFF